MGLTWDGAGDFREKLSLGCQTHLISSSGLAGLVTLSKSLPLSEAQFTCLSPEHNQVA